MNEIIKGQILKPKGNSEALKKCRGPFDAETLNSNGETINLKLFYLTNEFPEFHYIVISRIDKNYKDKNDIKCVVHLITHCTEYENIKVTSKLYDGSTTLINLTESYITKDIFLIDLCDIKTGKIYGNFHMNEIQKILDYYD